MRNILFVLLLFVSICVFPWTAQGGNEVQVALIPENPIVERARHDQQINFDFLLTNSTNETLEIYSIEVSVLSPAKNLIAQRRLDQNGDSIGTISTRTLKAGEKIVVFNPFYSFEAELKIHNLKFDFVFSSGDIAEKYKTTIFVHPREYTNKTKLQLPVGGTVFVHDGNDFYSHHRRLDITGRMTTALGIKTNMTRYAYDFTVINDKGEMYKGAGELNEDWFGFGALVYAPGDGIILESENSIPDNTKDHPVPMEREEIMKNVKRIFGNYVMIDHGNGEYSLLAHLKKGSLKVKTKDSVNAGQQLGGMGMSGDAFLVHLHYQLQSDKDFGEGLPSYFRNLKLQTGDRWIPVPSGHIDTGDIIRNAK